jgi:ComF family protein
MALSHQIQKFSQWIRSISHPIRLPIICLVCRQYHAGHDPLCSRCAELLIPLMAVCEICAKPLPIGEFMQCGMCLKNPPSFDYTLASYHYEEPLRQILHQFKYQERIYLTHYLTRLMLNALPLLKEAPCCLVPVPLHPIRLKERGFNQAAELAKQLSVRLNIPCDLTWCTKIINTKPQVGLSGNERDENIVGAFAMQPTSYRHVIIVDDIMTTGSTAEALAKAMKLAGALTVGVWCCARAC